jgi:hypothetical protein
MTCPEWAPRGANGGQFRRQIHRLQVRKTLLNWSPLTESNRRPSPYHGSLCSYAAPGRSLDLREHEHNADTHKHRTSPHQRHLPLNLPLTLILQVNHHMRSSIFSSMTGRSAFTVLVRGLRPKPFTVGTPCRAVQGWTSNATQTVLDRAYADRTAALALVIDDPGAGWWEAPRRVLVDSATDFAWLVTKLRQQPLGGLVPRMREAPPRARSLHRATSPDLCVTTPMQHGQLITGMLPRSAGRGL